MKKNVFLTIAIIAPIAIVWMLFRATSGTVSREIVINLAQENQLSDNVRYVPAFQEEDIRYWTKAGLNKRELQKEFEIRSKVVELAKETGYQIKTPGDLSYFAEALENKTMSAAKIKSEFLMRKKLETQAAQKIMSKREIMEVARQYGLVETKGYAPPFSSGDASYWESMCLDEKGLRKELGFRSKVIELAEKVGYRFPSQGDVSFFAEKLRDGLETEQMILEDLRKKI